MDLKTLKKLLNKTFKQISASPVEIIKVLDDVVLVKYEDRDPITGGRTKDYLYTACNLDGDIITSISYDSLELCERIVNAGALTDEVRIQEIVDAYNEEQRYIKHAM